MQRFVVNKMASNPSVEVAGEIMGDAAPPVFAQVHLNFRVHSLIVA